MRIVELIIDEKDENSGIEAVSLVEKPAIEENFIALNKQEVMLAEIDKEKRLLMGAALIPNRQIYRKSEKTGDEYYIYFSKDTVRKASELFFKRSNHQNATYEHKQPIKGTTIVESWIVEDSAKDKSALYGLNLPKGSWVVSMKIDDDKLYEKAKKGEVKGFSIEGYFADRYDLQKDDTFEELENEMVVEELKELLSKEELKSYSDYPDSVKNNAKRGIELNEAVNNKCATQVGKIRARQLANGEAVSEETIKRMFSFLSRAETYYDAGDKESCGYISYLLWGGKSAKTWAESKLKQIEREDLASMLVNDDFAIIDDRLAYATKDMAEKAAEDVGVKGIHEHVYEGKTWYMVGETHNIDMAKKCPPGYEKKDGKCVKKKSNYAEIGPRGGVKRSKKAPKSDTPNPNPKGKGSAKGNAGTSRGAKVSKADEATLKRKSDEFNERYKDKLGYGANVGALKSVFQRGLGAYNTSHSPNVTNAKQWGMARVNAFLYLIKNGRPQNPKYTTDYDLLPAKHPKSPKK